MSTFTDLVATFHELFTRDANHSLALGLAQRRAELPDPSLATIERDLGAARSLLEKLQALDPAGLDFDAALDAELMALQLEARIHSATLRYNGRSHAQQMPEAADGISQGLFMLFANDPRPAAERLADITARIEAVPAYLAAMQARLDTPVARWVAIEREKLHELPDLWDSLKAWSGNTPDVDAPRLARACAGAQQALAAYDAALASLPTTPDFALDEADARRLVALNGIELSFEGLHGIATAFLRENAVGIEELRARLCARYGLPTDTDSARLQAWLARRHAVAADGPLEDILARYEDERERILAWISQRALFPVPSGQDMRILRTPGFFAASIPAGAMEPPPPFREGVRTSLIYLTLAEELRAEHTELGIPGMMIHEGIPGHHLHLACCAMHPSVVRRHMGAMDQAEGWTTMLEDYMLDVGYAGEQTEACRFVTRRDLARLGARVAIDLFFMTGQREYLDVGIDCDIRAADPFVAAGNLLAAVTGFVPARVQAELNWYSQARGYPLSYLAGNHLVWGLKREMAAHRTDLQGMDLDRAFHKAFLGAGAMPMSFLRRVFAQQGLVAGA